MSKKTKSVKKEMRRKVIPNSKIIPSAKFKGKRKVKVFKKFYHFGLCELKRQRTKNWHKEFKRGDLTITMQAPESLNMYDKGILLSVLVLFSEKMSELNNGKITNNPEKINERKKELIARKGKPDGPSQDGFSVFNFKSVSIDFNKFCRNYAGVRPDHKKDVLDSIQRWLSTKTFYRDGVREFYTFHYIVDFTLDKENIATFILSQQLLDSCSNGLILAYDTFMSIKTEIGKMLYLFLMGNANTVFSYKSLKNALGLSDEDFKNRELIKQGLTALREKKIISDFTIKNKTDDIYYAVIYKALPDSVNDGDKTHLDGDKTHLDGDKTHLDGDKTHLDGDKTHLDGDKTHLDGDKTHLDGDKTHLDGDKTHLDGEGGVEIV